MQRLTSALVSAIAGGRFAEGDVLPSTRTLAEQLKVSRSVVVSAYEDLIASGFCTARAGAWTYVAIGAAHAAAAACRRHPSAPVEAGRAASSEWPAASPHAATRSSHGRRGSPAQKHRFDLRPGYPDATLIDGRAWRRAFKVAADRVIQENERARPAFGGTTMSNVLPEFRALIGEYLRIRRGIDCDERDIFVFPSVASALRVLAGALDWTGREVAFEDPGYVPGRQALASAGCIVRSVPVDDDGLVAERVPPAAAAVFVTPAHQFPLGSRLSEARRTDILRWAHDHDGVVVEDDFCGEFWHDLPPAPALRGDSRGCDHVVYLGTTSKLLTRDLRLVWAVTPASARVAVTRSVALEGETVSPLVVSALAHMLETGELTKHLVRSMRTYRARRNSLILALRQVMPDVELWGTDAGLHFVISRNDLDDVRASAELERAGVLCPPLSRYVDTATMGGTRPSGLACSYARLPESQALTAARLICEAAVPK